MKTTIATLLTLGLVIVLTSPSEAASKKRKLYYYNGDSLAQRYPSATPRQLQNAWAYDHAGHYYEMDSNAFPVGSQGWWALKKLEEGGHRGR